MQLEDFIMVSFAGFLATYVHMLFAMWAPKFGLPRLDFPKGLAMLTFEETFDGNPPIWLGLIQLHLNGIVFALLYATVIAQFLPGLPVVKGMLFGGILFLASGIFFVPVVIRHGLFFHKEHPRAWITAFFVHGVFGLVLGWLSPIL